MAAKSRLDNILGNFGKCKRVGIHCEKKRIGIRHSVSDYSFFANFLTVIKDEGPENRIICKIPLLQLGTTFF